MSWPWWREPSPAVDSDRLGAKGVHEHGILRKAARLGLHVQEGGTLFWRSQNSSRMGSMCFTFFALRKLTG